MAGVVCLRGVPAGAVSAPFTVEELLEAIKHNDDERPLYMEVGAGGELRALGGGGGAALCARARLAPPPPHRPARALLLEPSGAALRLRALRPLAPHDEAPLGLSHAASVALHRPAPHPAPRPAPRLPPAELEALATEWGRGRDGHRCVYCGKLHSRRYGLKIHLRTHTGYRPLRCAHCLRAFGDPSNLNKHVRLHAGGAGAGAGAGAGGRGHACAHCGRVLARRRDLERHVRARHAPGATEESTKESE